MTGTQGTQGTQRTQAGLLWWARTRLRAAAAARPAWRSRASAAKAAGAPIEPTELVLAMDREPSGSLTVATREAIYCQHRPGHRWTRLAWEDVIRVAWDDDRVCAWVTARRRPGSGAVVWTVVLNETLAARNPEIRAAVAAAIDGLRARTGIPASGAVIQAAGQELREMDAVDPGELIELSAAGEPVG